MTNVDKFGGRLLMYDVEMHLEGSTALVVGSIVEVIRGNGMREGERMGTATVTGFDESGAPELEVRIWAARNSLER